MKFEKILGIIATVLWLGLGVFGIIETNKDYRIIFIIACFTLAVVNLINVLGVRHDDRSIKGSNDKP